MTSTKEILEKYSKKLESQVKSKASESKSLEEFSKEYTQFRDDMIPIITPYEKWAKSLGNIIKIRVAEKDRIKIQHQLNQAHLDVTASQSITLAIVAMMTVFMITLLTLVAIFFINGSIQILLGFLGIITSLFIFYHAYTMPKRLAHEWRLKASSQMIPAVLYTVVYMKHTSNLERAIAFASEHLEGPLAMDFRKIFYDVEIGKFSTIKQSLDNYLEQWERYAPEFIDSFHLIESSLFEPLEERRIQILEKSLTIILDGVYEKMLKYSRSIRSPLTNIYMLGIVLPTLGLTLLPLASTLLGGIIKWQHTMVMFNILLPFGVYYMATRTLLKRPGGYGEESVLELNPNFAIFKSVKPWKIAALISIPLILISLTPFILQIDFLTNALRIPQDMALGELGITFFKDTKLLDFKTNDAGKLSGPFGPLGVILSLFMPLGIALFFSTAYKMKTKSLIKSREETKDLEREFTSSLFQLGNRLGDGTPAEIAFGKVAESTQNAKTHEFFSLVNQNIQNLGMSLERAIFDKKRGAITYYPSSLIATSMKILVESSKKGLEVAARSLMSISEYVKNIQKINQRLKDLLAEVVSDMRSNMSFLTPILLGIMAGLSTMITTILNRLQIVQLGGESNALGQGFVGAIPEIFNVTGMIPPYFIQITIGIYIIEIIFVMTHALVTIDSGRDILQEKYRLYKNLQRGIILYLITALISIIALILMASIALGGVA